MEVDILKALHFVSDLDLECDTIVIGRENPFFFGVNVFCVK